VAQVGTCRTEWMGVILLCTYKSFPKGRAFLCGGKGMGERSYHFPPILAAPTVLPPGSTLTFSMLFSKHDTSRLLKK
jgi:hypothetical protein